MTASEAMPQRRLLNAAATLTVLVLSRSALAGDSAAAEALFREGRALMNSGNYTTACPKLAESFEQEPATGTLLALAMCREQAGQTASAWASYGQVIARSRREGRADREQAARERAEALEPKLSRLTITVDARVAKEPGLVVKRNGAAVGAATFGTAVPVDPGEHTIEATAQGKKPWSTQIRIGAERDAKSVEVPVLEVEPIEKPASSAAPLAAGANPEHDAPATKKKGLPLRPIGIGVGAAGIVGVGVGVFFGLRAKGLNAESNESGHCDAKNACDDVGGEKRDDAKSAANVATVAMIAGGVLTAAGVTLFVLGGSKDEEAGQLVEAVPLVSDTELGVWVSGRF
jgi:hypothetical protein